MDNRELLSHTFMKKPNKFLGEAKRLGIIERYYDKKKKKHYYRLIPQEIRVFLK